jgi:hypothetical protein
MTKIKPSGLLTQCARLLDLLSVTYPSAEVKLFALLKALECFFPLLSESPKDPRLSNITYIPYCG